jgi:hypothetical protein
MRKIEPKMLFIAMTFYGILGHAGWPIREELRNAARCEWQPTLRT